MKSRWNLDVARAQIADCAPWSFAAENSSNLPDGVEVLSCGSLESWTKWSPATTFEGFDQDNWAVWKNELKWIEEWMNWRQKMSIKMNETSERMWTFDSQRSLLAITSARRSSPKSSACHARQASPGMDFTSGFWIHLKAISIFLPTRVKSTQWLLFGLSWLIPNQEVPKGAEHTWEPFSKPKSLVALFGSGTPRESQSTLGIRAVQTSRSPFLLVLFCPCSGEFFRSNYLFIYHHELRMKCSKYTIKPNEVL